MLALDLAEIVDGLAPLVMVQLVGAGRIENVHRPLDVGEVGLGLLLEGGAARHAHGGDGQHGQQDGAACAKL